MSVALLLAAQVTGYLPPPPPRSPITDPMFAASPVRELRRQWDDCVHSVGQLILMNGITDPARASGMLVMCVEYEDQLTGAVVRRYGLTKATRAVNKARQEAEEELRNYSQQIASYARSQPSPAPKAAPKPVYTVAPNETGCGSEYVTGSGASERVLGFVYDRSDDRRGSGGRLTFAFVEPSFSGWLAGKRRPIRFSMTITNGKDFVPARVSNVRGEAFTHNERVIVVTPFEGAVSDNMVPAPLLESVEISGPWAPVQFEATKFNQMVGDVQNCARQVGSWQAKR